MPSITLQWQSGNINLMQCKKYKRKSYAQRPQKAIAVKQITVVHKSLITDVTNSSKVIAEA